ncbi:MAG: fluoride efflux transporter CrcB [Phycisphaerales bacterium]|nr:fluoride efflux transporter CrcB [Phycisphaerales bacterium]
MRDMIIRYAAIGMAGFLGAVARVVCGQLFGGINVRFPIGTLFINVVGCLLIGWFIVYAGSRELSDNTRLIIGAGFVGTFTTFSTFIHESNQLADQNAALKAGLNLVGSLVLGLVAVRLGAYIGRRM